MKALTVDALRALLSSAKALRTSVNTSTGTHVGKPKLQKCQELGRVWFDDVRSKALALGMDVLVLEAYDKSFERLISLSGGSTARKSSVDAALRSVITKFKEDLIVPAQTHVADVRSTANTDFAPLLDRLSDSETNAYIAEGLACLADGHLRASVVLGWCATIDRIHQAIDHRVGLAMFNQATVEMASKSSGRFKRFSKKYGVESVSELRQVFDTDILLVLEYLQLIDVNQQVRLRSCFEMRNHAAHPGEAPVSRYNVLSFYSDIIDIVLANELFGVGIEKPADSSKD